MKLLASFPSPCHSLRVVVLAACVLALTAACSEERRPPAAALVTVNNFTLSQEQFSQLLKFEAEVDPTFQLSKEGRGEFLHQLIDQQVLVQEARARKLDEKERFRETIERFWEQTLIRDLLESQAEAIRRSTVVTKEEMAAWYQAHKGDLPDRPFAEQHDTIRQMVEHEKVEAAMNQWRDGLRAKARITIADPQLRQEAMPTPETKAVGAPMEVK